MTDMVLSLPGEHPGIGEEAGGSACDGVSVCRNPFGSVRYLLISGGVVVSGLQVMSRDGRHAPIASAHTREGHRRRGHASKLLAMARKDFESVKHASDKNLSGDARKWRDAEGNG